MMKRTETTPVIRGSLAVLIAAVATTLGACSRDTTPRPTTVTSGQQTAPPASATQPAGPVTSAGAGTGMNASPGMIGGMGSMMGTSGMTMTQGPDCPATVAGTTVQATSTANGMDMTFITSADVRELRRRVRMMAEHMNAHSSAAGGAGMRGMMGGSMHGMMQGMNMMGMPPVQAQVGDVEGGARMHVTPLDPSRLDEMRQHMQHGAQMMMQQHACPMAPAPSASTPPRSP